jgi:diaminopimelate decarboxylase
MTANRPAPEGTRLDELWRILPEEATATPDGVLEIGGIAVTELAERFGTPLHVYDETGLRRQARRFVDGLRARWPNSDVVFA